MAGERARRHEPAGAASNARVPREGRVTAAPPPGAPPLAQALLVAAVAWQQFLGGRTLDVALAEAVVAVRPAHPLSLIHI